VPCQPQAIFGLAPPSQGPDQALIALSATYYRAKEYENSSLFEGIRIGWLPWAAISSLAAMHELGARPDVFTPFASTLARISHEVAVQPIPGTLL
jgi:hypothetical protein